MPLVNMMKCPEIIRNRVFPVSVTFLMIVIVNYLLIYNEIEYHVYGRSSSHEEEVHVQIRRMLRASKIDRTYVDDLNIDDLWLGRVSDERLEIERKRNKKHKISLVVSHCDLPVDWIWKKSSQEGIKFESVHIYSKCDKPVVGAPPEAKIIRLPNVGRNDHSFAYHMNHMNDHTDHSDDEIIFFMKDNQYRLVEKDPAYSKTIRRSMSTLIDLASVNGFGCFEQLEQLLNIYPSFYYDATYLYNFYSKFGYVRTQRDLNTEVRFKSEYELFEDWMEELGTFLPQPFCPVCLGGMFSTTYSQIKQRQNVWGKMEMTLSRGDNIEEGHFAERSWAALLSKPLSTPAKLELKAKMTHHPRCYEFPWGDRCGSLIYTLNGSEPEEMEEPNDDGQM